MKLRTKKVNELQPITFAKRGSGICNVKRIIIGKTISVPRDLPPEEADECRRPSVQHWEFHHRSKELGLPWARGESGEERIKRQRRQNKSA